MKIVIILLLVSAICTLPIKISFGAYPKLGAVSATLNVGTPPIQGSFCFDMQLSQSWIRSKNCVNCIKNGQYSCSASTTCSVLTANQITTDSYILKGTIVNDTIDFGSFRLNLPFLEVTEEDSVSPPEFDGCIALGYSGYSEPDHLVKKMKDANSIEQAVVGIHLDSEADSTIMIGGYDATFIDNPEELVWFDVNNEWSFPVADIKLEDFHSGSSRIKILLDSGSIVVPSRYYNSLLSAIKSGKTCLYNQCTMEEMSYYSLPSLKIKVNDDISWKIRYSDYTKEIDRYSQLDYCNGTTCYYTTYVVFDITLVEGDYDWGLGGEGLRHFYTIYDYERSKLGM